MKYLLALLLLCATPAWAAITFDNVNTAVDSGVSSLDYSLTVGACANPILVVDVVWAGTDITISSLTIGGSSGTLIDNVLLVDVGNRWVATYRRVGVSTGANAIAISFSGVVSITQSAARSYCGVDQVSPTGTPGQGTGDNTGPASATVTSAAGELVVSAAHARNETFTGYGADQTERYNQDNGFSISGTDKAGAASVTMDHDISASTQWGITAVPLKPVAVIIKPKRAPIILQ